MRQEAEALAGPHLIEKNASLSQRRLTASRTLCCIRTVRMCALVMAVPPAGPGDLTAPECAGILRRNIQPKSLLRHMSDVADIVVSRFILGYNLTLQGESALAGLV